MEVVPFVNGNEPTAPPAKLPALINAAAVEALTSDLLVRRKEAIKHEIGCTQW